MTNILIDPMMQMPFLFAGEMVSATLAGFALCQAFVYFTQYTKDRLYIKLLVGLALFCEILHQALISYTLYWYTITNFNQPAVFTRFIWSIVIPCVPNSIAILAVQSFFTVRVWQFSAKARALVILVVIMILLEFGASMILVGKSLGSQTYAEFSSKKRWAMGSMSLATVIDVIIALSLVVELHRSRTGMKGTDSIINTLILFAMSTGLVTAIWAIAMLVSIFLTGMSFITMFFYFILGRLYFNSLLTSLNARQAIQASGTRSTISFIVSKDLPPLKDTVNESDSSSVEA